MPHARLTPITAVAAVAAVAAVLATAGCGGAESAAPGDAERVSAPAPSAPAVSPTPDDASFGTPEGTTTPGTTGARPSQGSQQLQGCDRYADPGLAAQVAEQPVLDVIAADPQLSWLHSALTGGQSPDVDYTDVLTGGPFTVFAPVDDPARAELEQELREDPTTLRFMLDFLVVPGQALSPEELVAAAEASEGGAVATLQGWEIAAFQPSDGSAELALSEDAVVPLCGDITTADATLYLVPQLMHPAGDYVVPGAE